MAAISQTLTYLDIANANVEYSKPLYFLENIQVLILKNNKIADFEEHVYPLLQTMNALRQLDLTNNPATSIHKYRDQIVINTKTLEELDNKKINQ